MNNPTPVPTTATTPKKIHLILLSGRSGSGKSSVAYELSYTLSHGSTSNPHVHIDADNLDAIYPRAPDADLMLANLGALWANYFRLRQPAVLIVSGTGVVLEAQAIRGVVERVCAANAAAVAGGSADGDERLGSDANVDVRVSGVVLEAGDEVVKCRLENRERGSEFGDCWESSLRMSKVLAQVGETEEMKLCRVNVEGRLVRDIAVEVHRFAFDDE